MELMKKIREGKKLVMSKLDRISRDAQDLGATINTLNNFQIKVIVLQLGNLDLASRANKLMLTMLAAVSDMERDLLIECTHAGLDRAKSEGKTHRRTPKTTREQQKKNEVAVCGR
jgi:putative DNA-invertase from lambdoid prophage Rac